MQISLKVNSIDYTKEADPGTPLLNFLREDLGLKGTKYGCGEGECGTCTVIMNGQVVSSCLMTAGQAHGSHIVTIEGMGSYTDGIALLDTFVDHGAVQCGFCTPGMALTASRVLADNHSPNPSEIKHQLRGHLCRCTGYVKIIDAVSAAATQNLSNFPVTQPDNGMPVVDPKETGKYARPANLDEALKLLNDDTADWQLIAGGTDLLVRNEHRYPELNLLDIRHLDELKQIFEDDEGLHIGAVASLTDIMNSKLVQECAPSLADIAANVGGWQVQNVACLGGNIANASPAADCVPPLMAAEAILELKSLNNSRQVPISEFFTGVEQCVMNKGEIITDIILPQVTHDGREIVFFEKVGTRKAMTITKASLAFRGWLSDGVLRHVKITLGAVAPTVIFAEKAAVHLMAGPLSEERLMEAGQLAHDECQPVDDIFSTADYCRKLIRGLLIRNLWPHLPK